MVNLLHNNLDISSVLFFNQFCGKCVFLDTLALIFLSVDALRTAILVALVMGIWQYGKIKNDKKANKRVIAILFSIILTLGIVEILNAVIDSNRPIVTYEHLIKTPIITENTKLLWNEGWVRNPKHGSFPSDTVALLTTMATGLFLWNRLAGFIAVLFVLFAGILPRLYFGLHYPSDMLIGVIVSIASTLVIERIKLFDFLSDKILETEKHFPYLFGVIGFYLAYIIADKFILLRKLPVWIKSMLGN